MTFTLLPVRALLVFGCLVITWFFAWISLLGRSDEDAKKPLSGWRNFFRPVVVFWARCMFFCGGFFWVTEKGKRVTSAEAPILAVAPHSSFFDSLPITYLNLTSVVAKTSAQSVPFFGTLTKFTQPVFVTREDPNSRQNTVKEILRRAETKGAWPQIVVFTEGTCTNRTCLISFKPGAFIPGVPVQPVCIKYPNTQDTVTWTWCGIGALNALFYTLTRWSTRVEIEFLPVYTPSEEERNDPLLFGRNVRAKMAEALGVPITEHSYEDGEVMCDVATQLGLPPCSILVELNLLFRRAAVSISREAVEQLFEAARRLKSVWLTETQFTQLLRSQFSSSHVTEPLVALYASIKDSSAVNGMICGDHSTGSVDIRCFLLDLFLLCRPSNVEDALQFAFKLYDARQSGVLTPTQTRDLVMALFQFCPSVEHMPGFTYDAVKLLIRTNPVFAKVFESKVQTTPKAQRRRPTCEKNGNDSRVKCE